MHFTVYKSLYEFIYLVVTSFKHIHAFYEMIFSFLVITRSIYMYIHEGNICTYVRIEGFIFISLWHLVKAADKMKIEVKLNEISYKFLIIPSLSAP